MVLGSMVDSFEATWLWQTAFAGNTDGSAGLASERAFFSLHFKAMRERAKVLVQRIAADMPGYTVHDETHLDALWETSSIVARPGITLNPAEAFVFGGAILLHDAAMTLAAYPGGLAELKSSAAWTILAC
jgi:hypothetical protein